MNGIEINNEYEIANEFNNYFVNIGPNLTNALVSDDPDKSFISYLSDPCPDTFYLRPIMEKEIISIIQKIKGKISSGYDDINIQVVKMIVPFISKPLSQIFNKSFETGIIPDCLKIAKVVPIYINLDKKTI